MFYGIDISDLFLQSISENRVPQWRIGSVVAYNTKGSLFESCWTEIDSSIF